MIGDRNQDFMARAIELSRQGMLAGEGGPFGAVIVRDGEIVAEGNNKVLATNDPTNHAEMVALRRAAEKLKSFDLSGCEIYVNAEPCPMCLGAIYWAQLKKVRFANTRYDATEGNPRPSLVWGFPLLLCRCHPVVEVNVLEPLPRRGRGIVRVCHGDHDARTLDRETLPADPAGVENQVPAVRVPSQAD